MNLKVLWKYSINLLAFLAVVKSIEGIFTVEHFKWLFKCANIRHLVIEEEILIYLAGEMCVSILIVRLFSMAEVEELLVRNLILIYINLLIAMKWNRNIQMMFNSFIVAFRSTHLSIIFKNRIKYMERICGQAFMLSIVIVYMHLIFPNINK